MQEKKTNLAVGWVCRVPPPVGEPIM